MAWAGTVALSVRAANHAGVSPLRLECGRLGKF
jgi:hypothetical protein